MSQATKPAKRRPTAACGGSVFGLGWSLIQGLLGDGVAASLRSDPQAKSLGEYLRAKRAPIPISLLAGGSLLEGD